MDGLARFAYESKLKALHEQVGRWIRDLVLDSSAGSTQSLAGRGWHAEGLSSSGELATATATTTVSMAVAAVATASGGGLVRRALLTDISRLCLFFGQENTMDLLLTQLLTFLNDQVT
jgi:hypothetical protein